MNAFSYDEAEDEELDEDEGYDELSGPEEYGDEG